MSGLVAIPIQYASVRISVDKGRHWSVVEHLLLDAICARPRAASELAKAAQLPIRLVVEALINLMRAGWAELRLDKDGLLFNATTGGQAVAGRETLPPITRPLTRTAKFAVEQVTGSVLRWREITFLPPGSSRLQAPGLVRLRARDGLPVRDPVEIITSLLDEDERFRGAQGATARPGQGFALVTRVGQRFIGLPRDAAPALRATIEEAARGTSRTAASLAASTVLPPPDDFLHPVHSVSLSPDDLVLGGASHLRVRDQLIERARSLVILHSTFVSEGAIDDLLPKLKQAVDRHGITAHLLWGQHSPAGLTSPTHAAVEYGRNAIRAAGLEGFVHVHPFSTRSHAKLLIADDGKGGFTTVVGSCNWLSARYEAFEASLRTGDPAMAADVIGAMARMAFEATGRNSGIVLELAGQASNLRRLDRGRGRATARLVCGAEHAQLIDEARDTAQRQILIASHRFGASAETLSLMATRAAVKARDLKARAYYATVSAPFDEASAKALMATPSGGTSEIRFARRETLHAKALAWDDDNILITSHNLLSADPSSPWSELGIHARAPGIATRLAAALEEL